MDQIARGRLFLKIVNVEGLRVFDLLCISTFLLANVGRMRAREGCLPFPYKIPSESTCVSEISYEDYTVIFDH